VYFFCVIWFC